MNSTRISFAVGASALALMSAAYAAPAKKTAPAAASTPPIATYWMDVSTVSGMGMGMMGGGRPDMASMMSMMNGGGASASHTLNLRLASRTPAPGAPRAEHLIPASLGMGQSLPLVTPQRSAPERGDMGSYQPRGRMLIYWGCGDHVAAGQPLTFDFAQIASGKVPENIRKMSEMMARRGITGRSGPTSAPGFGEWPNREDGRAVPPGGSLLGAHRVQANYSPPIAFSLGAGQDFMAPMRMSEAGAGLVRWAPVPGATGYALAMFGSSGNGDVIMWNSARSASFAALDYLSPGEVARAITAGSALPPSTTECMIPAEVTRAVPAGMVMGVAYGPELHFADAPRNPKWAVTVRYKSNATLMHGMGGGMGAGMSDDDQSASEDQQPKKKKRRGLGDLLGGAIPHP
jgi:hypothetical protein